MRVLDSPNGCFIRWGITAALLLIVTVFIGLTWSQMQKISDTGGVRFTEAEKRSRNFLLVMLFGLVTLIFFSLYKMIDCYL